jgi:hypothetical protein
VELRRAFMTSSQELVRPFTFARPIRDAERKVRLDQNLATPKFLTIPISIAPIEKKRRQMPPALNYRHWKNVNQTAQVNDQREAIVVAQHAAAVRDVGGRLIKQRLFRGGECADYFVGGNSQP